LDDEANPTFPQEHRVDKYRGHIIGIAGEALGSSNAQPYFSSRVRMGPWTIEEEEEEQARLHTKNSLSTGNIGDIIPEPTTMEKAFHQQSSREMFHASLATE
jgi:hypothetical protein